MSYDRNTPCLAQQSLATTSSKIGNVSIVVRKSKQPGHGKRTLKSGQ